MLEPLIVLVYMGVYLAAVSIGVWTLVAVKQRSAVVPCAASE
jgi:hypothetical protein